MRNTTLAVSYDARFTVSSPPRVRTVLPSTEKTMEPTSVPLTWAPSTDILGRTKLDDAFHICKHPSRQPINRGVRRQFSARRDGDTSANQSSVGRIGARRYFGPRSSLLGFDNNDSLLFSLVLHVPYPKRMSELNKTVGQQTCLIVESAELVIKYCRSRGCHAHADNSPTCPLF